MQFRDIASICAVIEKEGTQGHCGPHTGELFQHGRSLTPTREGDIYSFPAGKKLGGECERGRKENLTP